jgi:hypothetical protein
MILCPERIPDGIEPLSGFRVWRYVLRGREAELHSLTCGAMDGCPWERVPEGWLVASCNVGESGEHVAPAEDCTCGFYALRSLRALRDSDELIGAAFTTSGRAVIGRVELAGKVIEHTHGFRAERARITELIPFDGHASDVIRLGDRLGLPIGKLVPAPQLWEAVLGSISRRAGRRPAPRDQDRASVIRLPSPGERPGFTLN